MGYKLYISDENNSEEEREKMIEDSPSNPENSTNSLDKLNPSIPENPENPTTYPNN